ncbi:hypothetical protein PQC41_gp094 [Escherichia phage vB_EcoP_SU7]|uniref:Uncharacterized protein n=2 Tax=Suseptimavirus TaxID=3044836 RepID=A0A8F3C9H7_9CAUD|nr:hypothetical protein PQC41_gp094 [Escherichia phage vB_EcoP_SU7]YP_010672935.1 hypothetical protein PQC42_gp112 [Escherichia phage EK010]QWY14191.1 hypothetical protein SU7_93 [Escherichia phage vB_EcoP_SU7]UYE89997.1 hypothetical protein [Escherichia phage E20-1]BCG44951.1 hypothetical protein [Escherichia phage EK010]
MALTINKTRIADIPLMVAGVSIGSFFTLKEDKEQTIYMKVNKSSNGCEYHRAVSMQSGYVRNMASNMPVGIVFESATLDLVEKISET